MSTPETSGRPENRPNEGSDDAADSDLLTRYIRDGDRFALTVLVHRYERLVWSVCQRALRNRCDIEDAFQTTFLLFATNCHRIRKSSAVGHWLYGTAWRTSTSIRRRRPMVSFDEASIEVHNMVDCQESQLQKIARQHQIDEIDQQINAMHYRYRTPLVLYYFGGRTTKQIADQLDLSVAATEGRLRRGRIRLRKQLGSLVNDDGSGFASIWLAPGLPVPDALVQSTLQQCVASNPAIAPATLTQNLSAGIQMLISKKIIAVGVMLLIGLAIVTQGMLPAQENSIDIVEIEQVTQGESVTVDPVIESEAPEHAASDPLRSFHEHIHQMHNHIVSHLKQLFS